VTGIALAGLVFAGLAAVVAIARRRARAHAAPIARPPCCVAELIPRAQTCTFLALPDACDACREFDGEAVVIGSSRWKEIEPPYAGCTRRGGCRCVYCYVTVSLPPSHEQARRRKDDERWAAVGAMRAACGLGGYANLKACIENVAKSDVSGSELAYAYRRLGECAEAETRFAEAIESYETAMGLDPNVGVKRRLSRLRKSR
jgi:tetratricopeptide (TPR) repeat protein